LEKKLITKMILNCFKQYSEPDTVPIGEKELDGLARQILLEKQQDPGADLYEVINDKVYEFLTG